ENRKTPGAAGFTWGARNPSRTRFVYLAVALSPRTCDPVGRIQGGDAMETRRFLLMTSGAVAAILLQTALVRLRAETQTPTALSGQVASAEEGPMEGVVVSAKRDGSAISISVVTNAQGRFAFPAARLEPGHYTLKARAAGYELDGGRAADVASGNEA